MGGSREGRRTFAQSPSSLCDRLPPFAPRCLVTTRRRRADNGKKLLLSFAHFSRIRAENEEEEEEGPPLSRWYLTPPPPPPRPGSLGGNWREMGPHLWVYSYPFMSGWKRGGNGGGKQSLGIFLPVLVRGKGSPSMASVIHLRTSKTRHFFPLLPNVEPFTRRAQSESVRGTGETKSVHPPFR